MAATPRSPASTASLLTAGLLAAGALGPALAGQTALRIDHGPWVPISVTFSPDVFLEDAGDMDGDGVPEVMLITEGAPFINHRFDLTVLSGRDGQVLHQVDMGWYPSALGLPDLDGDGADDFVYTGTGQSYVLSGATGLALYGFQHVRAMTLLGDTDGDGFIELAAVRTSDLELIHVEFTQNSTVATSLLSLGGCTTWEYGHAIEATGDLDGDGRPDLIVRDEGCATGRVRGIDTDGNVLWTSSGASAGQCHGFDLAALDDVNGDGVPDLAVSDLFDTVRILSGVNGTNLAVVTGGDLFGLDIDAIHDHDGDGLRDLLVGAHGDPAGQLQIRSGADLSLLWADDQDASSVSWIAVSALQDVTGDGQPDFVAAGADGGFASSSTWTAVYSAADDQAGLEIIGEGLAGSFGFAPILLVADDPGLLGASNQILIGSSSNQDTFGTLHVGLTELPIPLKGGTLWFDPILNLALPVLPAGGVAIPLTIPQDTWLSGFRMLMQVSQFDVGAPVNVALSNAVALTLGGGVSWPD